MTAGGILDDLSAQRKLDPEGMLGAIEGLPEQCRQAWEAARSLALPRHYQEIDTIIVVGMGGSAIAGDMLRRVVEGTSRLPILNLRHYDLPAFAGERTLIIASSHSGETEEVLSAFAQALRLPAKKLVITGGGRLLSVARDAEVPAFAYAFRGQPRAALGWSLMPLLAIAGTLGLAEGVDEQVKEAVAVMEEVREQAMPVVIPPENQAKDIALRLYGKLPIIYGAQHLAEVARRWKTQINECSKSWAVFEELPEANHNSISGYAHPSVIAETAQPVFLYSDLLHPRVQLRYQYTEDLVRSRDIQPISVKAGGRGLLAQMLSLALFGDYVSYYLAMLNAVDPTPVRAIQDLKAWLAQRE